MAISRENTQSISICVDCLFLLANGEVIDAEGEDITLDHRCDVRRLWGDVEITLGSLQGSVECSCADPTWSDYPSCEPRFSWSSCEGCGSSLGGDRVHATAWLQ